VAGGGDAGGGFVGVGVGFGVDDGCGVDEGVEAGCVGATATGVETRASGARRTCRATRRVTGRCAAAALFGLRRCRGSILTVFGAGAFSTILGVAASRSSGALDSNAARHRYPEVTPAATSRQSRSASNEIRTRISIGLLPDSIGAKKRRR
jgi:hypothetical protein